MSGDGSWWVSAARVAYGATFAETLRKAYSAAGDVASARLDQLKQDTAAELRRRAEAAGTAEGKRLAAAAEARTRAAAESQAYGGAFQGVLLAGAVGLAL